MPMEFQLVNFLYDFYKAISLICNTQCSDKSNRIYGNMLLLHVEHKNLRSCELKLIASFHSIYTHKCIFREDSYGQCRNQ